ncbi:MAG: DUF2922 domain-containing protein [Tissierellia bacterium]|jgi:hypothetical protein|nr:DUF2922 domain-containing protein [Bacillota bacterium]NLK58478.1 DUF2922 domain-containing protein [Tissierellia bacterium]
MVKQLELVFVDTAHRNFTVRVDEPRADLTEGEIQAHMQTILAADVFRSPYGALASVSKANIVTRETTTYEFA